MNEHETIIKLADDADVAGITELIERARRAACLEHGSNDDEHDVLMDIVYELEQALGVTRTPCPAPDCPENEW